jgi:adenylate cyclase
MIHRHPFFGLLLLMVVSNITGSIFSLVYNDHLIVRRHMDERQTRIFWQVACPVYNIIFYPAAIAAMVWLMRPLVRCRKALLAGEQVDPAFLHFCRQRLVSYPVWQLIVNLLAWLPGIVVFPGIVCGLGGNHDAAAIWQHFSVSFAVSALFTSVQTFFPVESFLTHHFYPDFFRGARPADLPGVPRLRFQHRVILLWAAVAWAPLIALFVLSVSFVEARIEPGYEIAIATIVFISSTCSGFVIFYLVGDDLRSWVDRQGEATERIAANDFDHRILEQRPDEWGRLTDRFNDMAEALAKGRDLRETFGEFVSPEVRDRIMERFHGLEVGVETISVLFADIRGFTRRSAGAEPAKIGMLLNRYLTLAVEAVESKGGYVNKFLGDGIMALFGATGKNAGHADLAVGCALDMLQRLQQLNLQLEAEGEQPIAIGIGIHSGPALVGCFGATLTCEDGSIRRRREFTAIGETVNFASRMESLTKTIGGPIIISHVTRDLLTTDERGEDFGPQQVIGSPKPIPVARLG